MNNVQVEMLRPGKAPEVDDFGMTVFANVNESVFPDGILVVAGWRKYIPLGLKLTFESDYYAEIIPLSGSISSKGIDVVERVIEKSNDQELHILILNNGPTLFRVRNQDPLARIFFKKIERAFVSIV